MTKDSKVKTAATTSKKDKSSTKSKKRDEIKQRKKNNESSDSESDSYIETEDDEEQEDEIDIPEYRKFISKIFPSKYMDKKVKDTNKLKKLCDDIMKNDKKKKEKKERDDDDEEEDDDDSEEEEEESPKKKSPKKKPVKKYGNKSKKPVKSLKRDKSKKNLKKVESESENSSDDSEDDNDDNEKSGSNKVNIIFTIGGHADEDEESIWEDYDSEDEDYEDSETEDEDESVSTDSSSDDQDDDYDSDEDYVEEDDESEEEEEDIVVKKSKKSSKNHVLKITNEKETDANSENESSEDEVLKQLKELQGKNKNNKAILDCIETYEEKVKENKKKNAKKEKKQKAKNSRIFKRVIRDKNTMNDFKFFEKLETEEQKKIIKEVREINKISRVEKPYRMTLLESNIPAVFKASAMKKIASLRYMEPGSGEYYKIKNWVDTFMRIPFGKYETLPVNISDGVEACHEFMEKAQKTLDNAVYGLNDAKMQIMQMLGQLVTNPQAIGSAIAIKGPMGTGKCHGINTPILMYDGSIKMVQDIVVGDVVMGDDSQPRNVLSLGRGVDDLYEVIPTKGEKYVVNSEHILCLKQSGLGCIKTIKNISGTTSYKTVRLNNQTCKLEYKNYDNIDYANKYLTSFNEQDNIIEISVKDYLNLPKEVKKNWLKGYRVGIDFPHKPVLFDPYIIGLWLGDGTSSKPQITNQDSRILHYLMSELPKMNLELHYISKYDYNIRSNTNNRDNSFLKTLRHYNLINNKHIPNDYKINDRNIRLQILAGIIDTDGSYSDKDKCFDIIQKSKKLSDDILYLSRSLGFAAYQKESIKSCMYKNEKKEGIYYRICISGNNLNDIPTKCTRKQATDRSKFKNGLVIGVKIEHKGKGDYYGFELDNNHRYLLGDFTVTHNTSLVKEGISKILNRPFSFIALGGATDSSFLEGHSYTYEGSVWGKIVQIIIDSKCMNPVIYFDELDKISDTPKGEEIAGILTHLTDTSQNSQFHDKYFSEIDFDLSKCLFIFSYNDESKVNPILRDRMYKIQTKGYDKKEKTIISTNYLLPKIREQVKFSSEDIVIPDNTIHHIIEEYCMKEDGVRNLKRCLEIIYTKLNLYRLMKPGTNLFEQEMSLKVEFPMTVTNDVVDKLIKKDKDELSKSLYGLYV